MASQTARALATLGGRFVVANRTPEHAEALAKDLGPATTTSLDEVGPLLREAHVLVLATESWVLARREVATALPRRRDPLLIVDLGLPRVVEPSTADLPGVFLYGVEDLERIVGASLAARREAIPAAEAIVAEEAARFAAWSRALRVHPALSTLQTWAEALRRDEVAGLPAEMSEADRKVVDALTRRLVQKILGRPASRVVEGATNEDPALPTAEHLKRVFGLDETEDR
jgi:glutamyl-tRNA reductase